MWHALSLSLVAPNKLEKQTNSREKEVTFIVIFIVSEFVFHFVICFSGCCETSVGIRILFFLCFTIMLLFYLYSFFSLSLSRLLTHFLFASFHFVRSTKKKNKLQNATFNRIIVGVSGRFAFCFRGGKENKPICEGARLLERMLSVHGFKCTIFLRNRWFFTNETSD